MAVLKHLSIDARRVIVAQSRRKLHTAVNVIIVAYESANEANYDDRRFCGGFLRRQSLTMKTRGARLTAKEGCR